MRIFWVMILNVLVIGSGVNKGCLFSKQEIDELKNEVRDFLKGITVADNKVNSAVGLVSKAKTLSDLGMSKEQIQIVMAPDVIKLSSEIGASVNDIQKVVGTRVDERRVFTNSISTQTVTRLCPTDIGTKESNVTNKESAKSFLEGLQDNQLLCISGDMLGTIDGQAILEHIKDRTGADVATFLDLVIETKEKLISNYKGYKNTLEAARVQLVDDNLNGLVNSGEKNIDKITAVYSKYCITGKKQQTYQGANVKTKNEINDKFDEYSSNASNFIETIDKVLNIKIAISCKESTEDLSALKTHLTRIQKSVDGSSHKEIHSSLINKNVRRSNVSCPNEVESLIDQETKLISDSLSDLKKFLSTNAMELNTNTLNRSSDIEFTVSNEIGKIQKYLTTLIDAYTKELALLTNQLKK